MQPLAAPSSRRRSDAEIIARAHRSDRSFAVLGLGVLVLTMIVLLSLIVDFMVDGLGRIDLDFLTSFPSRRAADAGILSAWVGTTLVMPVTTALAVPLGVAAGLYLEEHAPSNWITHLIEINVTNLAGVPAIIHGLLALGLFADLRHGPDYPGGGHDARASHPAHYHRRHARGGAVDPDRDPRGCLF